MSTLAHVMVYLTNIKPQIYRKHGGIACIYPIISKLKYGWNHNNYRGGKVNVIRSLPYSVKRWRRKTLANSTKDYLGEKNIGDLAINIHYWLLMVKLW